MAYGSERDYYYNANQSFFLLLQWLQCTCICYHITIYHSVITIIGTKTESYRLFLSGYSSSVLVAVALAFAKPFMDCIMPVGSG